MFNSCPHLNMAVKPCVSYLKGGFCSRDDMFRCPEYMKSIGEVPLSHTAIKNYCQCHRKFYYSGIRGLQLIEPSWQIRQGQRASIILGWLHNRDIPTEEAVQKYQAFIMSELEESRNLEEPEDTGDLIIWAMKAMFDVYIEMDWHTLKGQTEYEFRWTDPEYPHVHGYIDLATLEHKDLDSSRMGRGIEFKWTGSPQWYQKFHMEDQLMSYFIGAPTLQSFEVRLFVPPIMKFKKGEKMSELFERTRESVKQQLVTERILSNVYYRNEFNLEEYKVRARMIAAEILRYFQMSETMDNPEYAFYQDKTACYTPVECDFMKICKYGIMPENLFKKRERH